MYIYRIKTLFYFRGAPDELLLSVCNVHLKQEYAFIFSVLIDSFLQVAEMVGHRYNQSSCENDPV